MQNLCGRTSWNGRFGHRSRTAASGLHEHHYPYAQGAGSDTSGGRRAFLCRGASRIRLPCRGEGRRYRGQPERPGRLHVRQHDPRDERHPRRLAERLQEAGVPRLVVHLPAHGAPADEGVVPADLGAREDERGLCPGQDLGPEVLRIPEPPVRHGLYQRDADEPLRTERQLPPDAQPRASGADPSLPRGQGAGASLRDVLG